MKRFLLVLFLSQLCITVHAQDPVDFGRRIRPLLAENCFACHGLDAEHREGGLRLDAQEGLYGMGDSGEPTVVSGEPDQSAMYLRMIAQDDDERMPPADSDKSLEPEEIELVKQWIAQGAKWQQHWSLVAPTRPGVPEVAEHVGPEVQQEDRAAPHGDVPGEGDQGAGPDRFAGSAVRHRG